MENVYLNILTISELSTLSTHEWEGYTWMGGLHMNWITCEREQCTWMRGLCMNEMTIPEMTTHIWHDYMYIWIWLYIPETTLNGSVNYMYIWLGEQHMNRFELHMTGRTIHEWVCELYMTGRTINEWDWTIYDWENDTWMGLNYIWLGEWHMNGTELHMTGRTIHEWDWTTYDWENDTWMGLYKVPTVFLFLFIIDKHVHTSTLIALATLQCAFLSISPYSRGSSVIYNHKHMDQIAILMIWREVARSVFYAGG